MELSLPTFTQPVTIRLFADFEVQIKPSRLADLTIQQINLLQAISAWPSALRRIARMSVETDLAGIVGSQLDNLFQGPSNEDLFDLCLSDADRGYWETLKAGPGDTLHNQMTPVFLAFNVIFRRAGVEEPCANSESNRTTVGPALDAQSL